MEISLKKVYFSIVKKSTGLKTATHKYPVNKFLKSMKDLDFHTHNVKLKELNHTYVLIREKKIESEVHFDNILNPLRFSVPKIIESPPIYTLIKWRYHDMGIFSSIRNYALRLNAEINILLNHDFSLRTEIRVNKIDDDMIELARRVRSTEEIIELSPYLRKVKKSLLYKIPVFKKPLQRQNFSDEQINSFRELLAKQAKTRKSNIELTSIYDKLNIECFASIKQDPESKYLICNFKSNLDKFDISKFYYLIIGNKKDTKEVVKALYTLD